MNQRLLSNVKRMIISHDISVDIYNYSIKGSDFDEKHKAEKPCFIRHVHGNRHCTAVSDRSNKANR